MGTLLGGIPGELRSLHRWVCADAGSKRPTRCFGEGYASVSNHATWGTFDQASACVEAGLHDYAGFVFADDGLVGIDIDGAFDPDGMLSPGAAEAIRACGSYTEVSKSGNGIHIICRGDIPFKGRANREGWEIYKDARYFVMTGRTVIYGEVADAQDGIDAVLARHFAEEARESAGGAPSARVWDPVWRARGDGRIAVEPEWPDVTAGSRHLALVSYCGQQWGLGCPRDAMLPLALRQNERHIRPPLPDDEVEQVVRSVTKYRR